MMQPFANIVTIFIYWKEKKKRDVKKDVQRDVQRDSQKARRKRQQGLSAT